MANYAVFDLETTGFSPTKDRIIQIAWVVVRGTTVMASHSYVVNPVDVTVSEKITQITGLTQDDVNHGSDIEDILDRFEFSTEGLSLVGHNVIRFDSQFIEASSDRSDMEVGLFSESRYVDTAALYKGWKLGVTHGTRESHADYARRVLNMRVTGLKFNLQLCCKELGIDIPPDQFHNAMGDTTATLAVFQKLTELGVEVRGV